MEFQARYQIGNKIDGRYEVHQVHRGGMGEVYLCLDLETNLPYALKTFQQRYLSASAKLRTAFENEVSTWVALEKHPNIVRCFYMDVLDNQPFMILEWIANDENHGADLRNWLRRGPLKTRLTLDFIIDICRGLSYAQKKQPGIVHRDLKPDNILVAQGPVAKITDFGLAKIVQETELEVISNADGKVGTPPYMAPEQWRGDRLDIRTDIYAVGCILYELLIGQWPYAGRMTEQWSRLHLDAPIPHLPPDNPLSPTLNTVLQRCLAKQPDERFPTAEALLQALSQIYADHFDKPPKSEASGEAFTMVDYNNRGQTYAVLQRYEAALADFNRAIELNPNFAKAYLNRAATFSHVKQYDAALADYEQAVDIDPNDPQIYMNRGVTYRGLRQYEAALVDYNQAIELDPNNAHIYYNRGVTYAQLQRLEQALADYHRAIELEPDFATAYYNRGIIYTDRGQYKTAFNDFSRSIELNPNEAQAYLNRGIICAYMKRYEPAFDDYNRAIKLDPTNAQAYYNRGVIHLDQKQYQAALADYNRAIELEPNDARFYYNRGLVYDNLGQYETSLADYNRAIELEPNNVKAYRNRGVTYSDLQRYDNAMADYNRAIELDPDYAPTYFNLGMLLVNTGRLRESLPHLEQAARLGLPQAHQVVAQVRKTLGQSVSASQVEPAQAAFEAFQRAASVETMQQAVARYPLLAQADFIAAIERTIAQQVPAKHRAHFEQRLAWLKQIAQGP